MKRQFCFTGLLISALVLCLPVQASAGTDDTGFMNSITEEGECGHQNLGKLQYLSNSDQASDYEVSLKYKVTNAGRIKESLDTKKIEAGGKELLGCSISVNEPLINYRWSVLSETKTP